MRALFLARELHWSDHDALRDEAADLGIRAYQAIGRHPLAEVLRVHVAHRDLTSVHIYRAPPIPPLVEAAATGDEELVALLLADDPDPATIFTALGHTRKLPLVDRLLAVAAPDADARLLAIAVAEHAQAEHWKQDPSDHATLIDHLLARGADPGPAFAQALASQHLVLASRLAALVDLTRPDPDGLLPLHRAAQAGAVTIARQLLDRGADRFARDAHGKTPHDRARDIWQTRRAESLELLGLLPASLVAVAVSTDYAPGDAVTHAKFGPGVVLTRDGAGDTAKLTIDFADAQRQLLAKFIRRA